MNFIEKEWKENLRGKGLWLAFGIMILVSIVLLFSSSALSVDQGFLVLLLNLFNTLLYIIPILCLLLGSFSVIQEKEQKTLIMLLTRQDSYTSFLLKKSIAVQSVLIIPMLIWFFIYLVPVKFLFQINGKEYLVFLFSFICLMAIFTQIGLFIGSISRSRMQIVGFSIIIWFYLFFLHDLILLSYLPSVSYDNVKLFSLLFFLNPFQAARMYLESNLGIYSFGHMSNLLESFMWTKPGVFLLGNVILTLFVSFTLGVLLHRKEGSE